MSSTASPATKPATHLARVSCLTFGIGLLLCGLAPLVFARLTGTQPPTAELLARNSGTLVFGLAFLALGIRIAQGSRWALGIAAGVSLLMLLAILSVALRGPASALSLFALLLALNTALTCSLALRPHSGHSGEAVVAPRPSNYGTRDGAGEQ